MADSPSLAYSNPAPITRLPLRWKVARVEDVCLKVTSGGTPSRSNQAFYKNGTIDWYKTGELKDGWLEGSEERITSEAVEASSAKVFPPNTVLLALYGDGKTITSLGILRRPGATNQACCAMITDPAHCDYRFLFYSLRLHRQDLIFIASGGAQRNLSGKMIRDFGIRLPPLPEQRAIAAVLGALDDKIELNRKTARVLEEIARAVFKSWFVDFDPVRYNMQRQGEAAAYERMGRIARFGSFGEDLSITDADGRKRPLRPEDIHRHVAHLFPNRLVESPIGEVPEVPEGWTEARLTDHFDLAMGQSPPGSTYNENGEGLPFYQGRTDYGFRFPTPRVYCTAPTRFAEPGDTLVSVRAPVGDVNMAIERCAVGRGVAAIRHKSGSSSLTYYAMHALRPHFLRFEAEGTVFGAIGKTDFERLPFVAPPPPVVCAFERFAAPIDQRIEVCERQASTLSTLRDALLPKLISGELRITDAEKVVGRAG